MVTFYHLFKAVSITTSPKLIKQILVDISQISVEYLKNHTFIIFGQRTDHYNFLDDLKVNYSFFENSKELIKYLGNQNNSRIIIHGNPFNNIFSKLYFNRINLINVSWINWGHGHVYSKRRYLSYLLDRYLLSKFNAVIALTLQDLDMIKRSFPKTNSFFLPYKSKQIENILEKPVENNLSSSLKVMVGVSGGVPQRHLIGFEALKSLNVKDLIVYSPLSYNNQNMDYIATVKSKGRELFGDSFQPLEEVMKIEEYVTFLSELDALILPSYKQNGLFNIYVLLFMGKKIFVSRNSNLHNSLSRLGFKVEVIESISEKSLKTPYNKDIIECNRDVLKEMYEHEAKLAKWTLFYQALYKKRKLKLLE